MLRLHCPTGCAGFLPRPYARRAEPVRCGNCRAWLAAPVSAEDGGLCEAVLLAAPGRSLSDVRPSRRLWPFIVILALFMIAAIALGFLRAK